jgi:hypothetical protein
VEGASIRIRTDSNTSDKLITPSYPTTSTLGLCWFDVSLATFLMNATSDARGFPWVDLHYRESQDPGPCCWNSHTTANNNILLLRIFGSFVPLQQLPYIGCQSHLISRGLQHRVMSQNVVNQTFDYLAAISLRGYLKPLYFVQGEKLFHISCLCGF